MFGFIKDKDAAESFIWTDGTFESVSFSRESRELTIDFTDYCEVRYQFTFRDVDLVVIADPVYCIHSSHAHEGGKRRSVLMDDDQIVVSFLYSTVEQHEHTA